MKNNKKRIRFIEKDYMLKKILNSSEYIQPWQAEMLLDDQDYYCDVTFEIEEKTNGFKIEVVDNYTNDYIKIDELNNVAYDFYCRMSVELSKQKIREKLGISA